MPANDPKPSDRRTRRGTCMVGGKAAEAGTVTCGAVRCSAWLGDSAELLGGQDSGFCAVHLVCSVMKQAVPGAIIMVISSLAIPPTVNVGDVDPKATPVLFTFTA
ncbi:hypothetical protein [Methyloglobulus sp.]|uniref:hypothetical protein n=1 Tax=Methyloglobulus sp. TaxID=2518622 RepID=UPI003989E126